MTRLLDTPIVYRFSLAQTWEPMPHVRNAVEQSKFNPSVDRPYALRRLDFQAAMQDVYDIFYDLNTLLLGRGL